MRVVGLEAIRGGAAVVVLLSHTASIPGFREVIGSGQMLLHWGTTAVIVFFLLSGTVIRLSSDRTPRSSYQFIRSRAARLVPLYLVSVGISVLVLWIDDNTPPIWTVVGNLLFVQSLPGYLSPTLDSNPPLWSLAFEAFFYLLFMLSIGRQQKKVLTAWAVIALIGVISQFVYQPSGVLGHLQMVSAYSTIWLLGYFAVDLAFIMDVRLPNAFAWAGLVPMIARVDLDGNFYSAGQHFLVAMAIVPLFVFLISDRPNMLLSQPSHHWLVFFLVYAAIVILLLTTSRSLLVSKIVYVLIPLLAILIGIGINRVQSNLLIFVPYAMILAQLSYALYLFHYPIYYSARFTGLSGTVGVAILLPAAILVSVIAEFWIQPRMSRVLFPQARRLS